MKAVFSALATVLLESARESASASSLQTALGEFGIPEEQANAIAMKFTSAKKPLQGVLKSTRKISVLSHFVVSFVVNCEAPSHSCLHLH